MGKRRDSAQIARDRRKAADYYLQGWLQADIAKELSIDQSTVSRDLSALHDEWLKSALLDFNEAKAQELAKIDRLEREYWDAWVRSKEDAEITTVKAKAVVIKGQTDVQIPAEEREKTIQKRGQVGDSRFLAGVQWCIEQRCKIVGIYAAAKFDIDWRQKAVEDGIDPDSFVELLAGEFTEAMLKDQK
jgi:hypothetical protein